MSIGLTIIFNNFKKIVDKIPFGFVTIRIEVSIKIIASGGVPL